MHHRHLNKKGNVQKNKNKTNPASFMLRCLVWSIPRHSTSFHVVPGLLSLLRAGLRNVTEYRASTVKMFVHDLRSPPKSFNRRPTMFDCMFDAVDRLANLWKPRDLFSLFAVTDPANFRLELRHGETECLHVHQDLVRPTYTDMLQKLVKLKV